MQGQLIIAGITVVALIAAVTWPRIIPIIYILGSIFVPIQAISMLAGGDGSLETSGIIKNHPITYILIPAIIVYCVLNREKINLVIRETPGVKYVMVLMTLFCVGASAETLIIRGVNGLPTAFENYLGPFLLFVFLIVYYHGDEDSFTSLLKIFVNCVLLAAIYGIAEYFLQSNILFGKFYANLYWYQSFEGDSYRVTTILGHPLVNATYFLLAVIISPTLYKTSLKYVVMFILLVGIMITGSRASFALSVFAILLFYFLKKDTYLGQLSRIGAVLVLLLVLFFLVFNTPLGQTILDRFATAEGSTLVRFLSLGFLLDVLMHPDIIGNGLGGSTDISFSIFHTNDYGFENPWLLVILDCGIVLAVIYLAVVVYILWRSVKRGDIRRDVLSRLYFITLLSCQMMFFMFNSFGTRSVLNYLFWFLSAGIFIHRTTTRDDLAV